MHALPRTVSLRGRVCGVGCWRVPFPHGRGLCVAVLQWGGSGPNPADPLWRGWPAPNPSSPRDGWHRPSAGSRHLPACCRLLWVPLNNKCVYWDFCHRRGTNNPLLDPIPGLPSPPAPAAAATLARLGKSLTRSPGGGWVLRKPGLAAAARIKASPRPVRPALPQAPDPAPQKKTTSAPQNSPETGQAGWNTALPLAPHPNQPVAWPRVGCVLRSV